MRPKWKRSLQILAWTIAGVTALLLIQQCLKNIGNEKFHVADNVIYVQDIDGLCKMLTHDGKRLVSWIPCEAVPPKKLLIRKKK